MLLVVRCLSLAVNCLLSDDCCLCVGSLVAVCCFLSSFVGGCLLFVVCYFLFGVSLYVVCCLLSVVCCVLLAVCCLLFCVVCCVSCLFVGVRCSLFVIRHSFFPVRCLLFVAVRWSLRVVCCLLRVV